MRATRGPAAEKICAGVCVCPEQQDKPQRSCAAFWQANKKMSPSLLLSHHLWRSCRGTCNCREDVRNHTELECCFFFFLSMTTCDQTRNLNAASAGKHCHLDATLFWSCTSPFQNHKTVTNCPRAEKTGHNAVTVRSEMGRCPEKQTRPLSRLQRCCGRYSQHSFHSQREEELVWFPLPDVHPPTEREGSKFKHRSAPFQLLVLFFISFFNGQELRDSFIKYLIHFI